MDRRDKAARLASLQKLKKRKNNKIGDESEEHSSEETETGNAGLLEEEYTDDDDDEMGDFIEETEEEIKARTQRRSGPSISTFFKQQTSTILTKDKREKGAVIEDTSAALKDDFFKTLVAQLSESEEEEQKEKEEVHSVLKESRPKKVAKLSKEKDNDNSSSDCEFVPEVLKTVAFPELAPISSLNQLLKNNEMAMDTDTDALEQEEEEEEAVEFPDESDLQQFEEEMSFIIETEAKTNESKKILLPNPKVHVKQIQQIQTSKLSTVTSAPSAFGMVASKEEIISEEDGNSCLVYWFDAYEKQPNGPVYLFGKMKDSNAPNGLSTCCVIVENIKRNLFFLPKESTTFEELKEEVAQLMSQYGITRFNCKQVTRKYAFELPDVPTEGEYLKLSYEYSSGPQLPLTLSGNTFTHVFGINTGAQEMFLIKRKIMGPCWLKIKPASISGRSVSWCRTELTVTDPKQINVLHMNELPHPPLMTSMTISLRTVMNPESKAHEIVAISGLIHDSIDIEGSKATNSESQSRCSASFTVVRDLENVGFTNRFGEIIQSTGNTNIPVEKAKNEKALLGYFMAMLQRHDPDILIGHNFLGFDLGVILHRMKACKVDFWSRIGRLNWTQWPKGKGNVGQNTEASYAERQILCGRVVCDTYLAAKDLVKAKNYSLSTLAETQLGFQRTPIDYERIKEYFDTPELLRQLLTGNEMDAFYISMLMFQMMILPLTLQLTNIAGNLWSKTLTGARAERNEFLLLHEFHNQKFICPDKKPYTATPAFTIGLSTEDEEKGKTATSTAGKRKPAYSGGLVLEPKKGFYDRIVLLLDFNSLYPSIIQEYNICFTSVERQPASSATEALDEEDAMPQIPDASLPTGVLPRILKTLVERRRAVKSLMKRETNVLSPQYAALNIRQQALKLTANSMYGCLGFSLSRFYAKPLAMLITSKGREILQNTVNLTRDVCQLDVIYGDTDSIMVNTGTKNMVEARAMGQRIKKAVNERYKLLEIELDGIFQKLLLLKKKKYAALIVDGEKSDGSIVTKLETKGLDLVRRDWCELSVSVSTQILDEIMKGESSEDVVQNIHEKLRKVAEDLKNNSVPLEKFIISKNLTKDPNNYADAKTQPHVTVALRMKEKGLQSASSGDTIPYIICLQNSRFNPNDNNPTSNQHESQADFAYHPDEVRKDASLQVDTLWYLQTQLHPPIARLCEHIEGTDSGQLASCLGLDPKKYTHRANNDFDSSNNTNNGGQNHNIFSSLLSDEERFASIEKLKISCPNCSEAFEFTGFVHDDSSDPTNCISSALKCKSCNVMLPICTFYFEVLNSFKKCSNVYNSFQMKCDEVGCPVVTERLGVYDKLCPNEGCRALSMKTRLSAAHLYNHLSYLKSLFSPEKVLKKYSTKMSPADIKLFQQLSAEIEPIRAFIDEKMKASAYPVIDFKQIFSYLL